MQAVSTTRASTHRSHHNVRNALIALALLSLSVLSLIFSFEAMKNFRFDNMADVYYYSPSSATNPANHYLYPPNVKTSQDDDNDDVSEEESVDVDEDEDGDEYDQISEDGDDGNENDDEGADGDDGNENDDEGADGDDGNENDEELSEGGDDRNKNGDEKYFDDDDENRSEDGDNEDDDEDEGNSTKEDDDNAGGNDQGTPAKYDDDDDFNKKQNGKDTDTDNDNKGENESTTSTDKDGRRRMNVIVLYPDDWRHNSIGSENPIIQTPFLDSLASQGMRFRQNAVTTSICWTSRATLFSGQWASRHQSPKLFCPNFAREQSWNASWPKLLQDDGYYVGHVGKWQYHSNNEDRFDWQSYHEGMHWYDVFGGKTIAAEDKARDDAIEFLNERPKDKPFAMTVAFYPPKAVGVSGEPGGQWFPKNETRALYDNITIPEPFNMSHAFSLLPEFLQYRGSAAVQRFNERFRSKEHYQEAIKNIYALITQIDTACRQIVEEVKKLGLYDNTMIIFTTDNGMFHGSHGLAGKWYPYQESIRVPLIIYDPRMPKDKVGTLDDHFTLNVDLAETILGAAGLKPHKRMQGRDISDLYLPNKSEEDGPTALEQKPWRDEFFYEFTFFDNEVFIPSSHAVVQKKWKYIDFYNHGHEQLFDLETDPLEFTDVKDRSENREILALMKHKLNMYRKEFTEPKEHQLACERHSNGKYWLSKNPTDE